MNNLSNILFKNIKQKIEVLPQFKKDIVYINKFYKKIFDFQLSNNKKDFNNLDIKVDELKENFLIVYIISISFLKANTMIHISDTSGNMKLFYSAGLVNLTGKQKKQRFFAVLRLIKLIYKKAYMLFGKPVALHLNNVNRYKVIIVKKLKQKFFIKIIKAFDLDAYNGCRKKKERRKR